jgi:tRNA threonylcarbamoyladenosine biosynthesis protein TsaB
MIVLGIDTATDAVSVALHDGNVVLASSEIRSDRQHAEALTPMIDFVCKQASIELWDVGGIAVDIGPGLFTGMRVGIASAQAIAQVIDVSIIPVTSLDVLVALSHGGRKTEASR